MVAVAKIATTWLMSAPFKCMGNFFVVTDNYLGKWWRAIPAGGRELVRCPLPDPDPAPRHYGLCARYRCFVIGNLHRLTLTKANLGMGAGRGAGGNFPLVSFLCDGRNPPPLGDGPPCLCQSPSLEYQAFGASLMRWCLYAALASNLGSTL